MPTVAVMRKTGLVAAVITSESFSNAIFVGVAHPDRSNVIKASVANLRLSTGAPWFPYDRAYYLYAPSIYCLPVPKKGIPYEKVVAEVIASFDASANISQGNWVEGPDGSREMDVLVEGTVNGTPRRLMVECKDFNPKSTGPVGIEYVDALDSKRRDLAVDSAVICSNAGFTTGAINKAKRVGIGLISVLKKGDARVRFQVVEEVYPREIKVERSGIILKDGETLILLNGLPPAQITYRGLSIEGWAAARMLSFLAYQPIVNGPVTDTLRFRHPVELHIAGKPVQVTTLKIWYELSGRWLSTVATIDATNAIYDWIRRRVRIPSNSKYTIDYSFDINKATPISAPPSSELRRDRFLQGEVAGRFMRVSGLLPATSPYANLGPLILPEDLTLDVGE